MTRLSRDQIKQARIASYMQIAADELAGARQLMDTLPRQSAFFMQQCVEKLLRAVLENDEYLAGNTHSIEALARLLPDHHLLKALFASFDDLSGAATRYRYPTERGVIRSPDHMLMPARLADIEDLQRRVVAFLQQK